MIAVVNFFLLRRVSVVLLSVALLLNVAYQAFHVMWTNVIEAVGGAALVGGLLGWVIQVAVIVYARRLAKRAL